VTEHGKWFPPFGEAMLVFVSVVEEMEDCVDVLEGMDLRVLLGLGFRKGKLGGVRRHD
jgi:hypothetical protein